MAITLNVSITGAPEGHDVEAATLAVEAYNAANEASLPTSPIADLADSYETVQAALLASAHASYAQQAADAALEDNARQLWRNATDAQRSAAIAALTA